jgi:hypothetical protein
LFAAQKKPSRPLYHLSNGQRGLDGRRSFCRLTQPRRKESKFSAEVGTTNQSDALTFAEVQERQQLLDRDDLRKEGLPGVSLCAPTPLPVAWLA